MRKKRVFIVKIPPMAKENMEKFLERLSKALAGDPVLIKMKGDQLRVEVYGGEVLAKRTQLGIRKVLDEFTTPRAPKKGYTRLGRRAIFREAGVAIPLDVLELVLSHLGYDARVEDDELVTRAPVDVVFTFAQEIARVLGELATLEATRTAKKFFMAVGAVTGANVLEMIDWGFETETLEEDDEGKLYVTVDWREAVKRVLSRQRIGGFGFGAGEAEEDL
ncbi:MAG: DUF2067 domain-containing protein [Crenarchaeota archaeon]|nr:DUF2067 domain-containing protein [Thermoproteota archaeon]